jgi:hypothetical protein
MWNKNDPRNNIWRTRDVAEMAAAMKTAPIFIDEVKSNGNNFRSVFFCHKFIEFILIIEIVKKKNHITPLCFLLPSSPRPYFGILVFQYT